MDKTVCARSALICRHYLTCLEAYEPLPGPSYENYDPGRPYTMEKPPTLGVTQVTQATQPDEFSPPLKGPEVETPAPSFLDDGAQATRYLPAYPALQPDAQPAVTQPVNGEQLVYSNPPLPEYYTESQLGRPVPYVEGQVMGTAVVSAAPFNEAMPMHRPTSEPDGAAPQYSVVPAYDGHGHVMIGDGSDQAIMYHDARYDVMMANPMNRPAARRGPFKNNDDREKTAQTRKMGSCVRCRMQRIRVWSSFPFVQTVRGPVESNGYLTVPDKSGGARGILLDMPEGSLEHKSKTATMSQVQNYRSQTVQARPSPRLRVDEAVAGQHRGQHLQLGVG